jgi:hypothetical protein
MTEMLVPVIVPVAGGETMLNAVILLDDEATEITLTV